MSFPRWIISHRMIVAQVRGPLPEIECPEGTMSIYCRYTHAISGQGACSSLTIQLGDFRVIVTCFRNLEHRLQLTGWLQHIPSVVVAAIFDLMRARRTSLFWAFIDSSRICLRSSDCLAGRGCTGVPGRNRPKRISQGVGHRGRVQVAEGCHEAIRLSLATWWIGPGADQARLCTGGARPTIPKWRSRERSHSDR